MLRRFISAILLVGLLFSPLCARMVLADDPAPAHAGRAAGKQESSAGVVAEQLGLPLQEIEKAYEGTTPPESVRMLLAIARGSRLGPGEGWFGPADARYSWKWLAERNGVSEAEAIPADKFQGTELWFSRLDRNKDGRISPDDLDWSDRNPWIQQAYLVNRLFRRMETSGDGKLTREEWSAFFDAAGQGN